MTDDELRESLTAVLWDESRRAPGRRESAWQQRQSWADALIPVVKRYAAGELRAIAYAHEGGSGDMEVWTLLERAADLSCFNCGDDPTTCDCDES